MQWINDERIFEDTLSLASECVRIDETLHPVTFCRFIFDPIELCTRPFFALLKNLMNWSGDNSCYYLVLDPDPRTYFNFHFKKFPLVEIRKDELATDYFAALAEDPGDSPADAIGTNWMEYLIVPRSRKWFVRGRRDDDDDGGHLCVPPGWSDRVSEAYRYARLSSGK